MNRQVDDRGPPARRRFLAALAGFASTPLLAVQGSSGRSVAPKRVERRLVAGAARAQLVPNEYPATNVWAYNGTVPGPILRVRQGDRLRVHVQNALAEGTTVHWHGVRVPNAMDGVPVLTQPLIEPGGSFDYEMGGGGGMRGSPNDQWRGSSKR